MKTRFDVYTTDRLSDSQRAFLLVHYTSRKSGPFYGKLGHVVQQQSLTAGDRGAVLIARRISKNQANAVHDALAEFDIQTHIVSSLTFRPPFGLPFESTRRVTWRKLLVALIVLTCIAWATLFIWGQQDYLVGISPLVLYLLVLVGVSYGRKPWWRSDKIDDVLSQLRETRRGQHFAATSHRLCIVVPGGHRWVAWGFLAYFLVGLSAFPFMIWMTDFWLPLFTYAFLVPFIPLIGRVVNERVLDRRQVFVFADGEVGVRDSLSNYPNVWSLSDVKSARIDAGRFVLSLDHHRTRRIPIDLPEAEGAAINIDVLRILNGPWEPTKPEDLFGRIGRRFWRAIKRRSVEQHLDDRHDDDKDR